MNGDLYFSGKKYISSSRAAKLSGYVNDYIGQLCRDGKLECQMVGRSWYVSLESLVSHKNSNAVGTKNKSPKLSLDLLQEEASKTSVDARLAFSTPLVSSQTISEQSVDLQLSYPFGNLKASEFYLANNIPADLSAPIVLNVNDLVVQTPIVDTAVGQNVPSKTEEISLVSSSVFHPKIKVIEDNLVTGNIESFLPKLSKTTVQEKYIPVATIVETQKQKVETKVSLKSYSTFFSKRFPMAVASAVVVLVAVIGFRFSFSMNPEIESAYFSFGNNINNSLALVLGSNVNENNSASVLSGAKHLVDSAGLAVYHGVNRLLFDTSAKILAMIGISPSRTEVASLKVFPQDNTQNGPSQAMVVVPTTPQTDRAAVVAKIKNSFSDEVTVVPESDGSSGVITPVFKKTKGDDYLYVLVPIKN
jgi:hypothetical protein